MTRKLLIIFALIILYAMPGHAVLKESNLDTTLIMLRSELTAYHIQLEKESSSNKREREALFKEVYTINLPAAVFVALSLYDFPQYQYGDILLSSFIFISFGLAVMAFLRSLKSKITFGRKASDCMYFNILL